MRKILIVEDDGDIGEAVEHDLRERRRRMKKEKATLVVTKAFKKYPSEASVYILIAPPRYILAEHFCTNHYFACTILKKMHTILWWSSMEKTDMKSYIMTGKD